MTYLTLTRHQRVQITHFFRGQIGSWRPRGVDLGSGSRLHRIRHQCSSLVLSESPGSETSAEPAIALDHDPPEFSIQSSQESPKRCRMRCRRLPNPRPIPEGVQEPICIRKKCAIWARWRPVPVKNVNYQRAPSSRRSGLLGPHTTPPIVNYKYMESTPREGYFWLPTLRT